MLDHTIPKYIFIRTTILGLRAITPFSIFYASFSIAEPPQTAFRRFLLAWSCIETAFWLCVYIPRKRALQAPARHPPPPDNESRKELFWKCWDKIPHPEYFVSRWFLGARPSEVRRDNVREFYEWALMNRGDEDDMVKTRRMQESPNECREEEEELDSYVDGMETLLGRKLEPGRGSAKSMRLTVDAVNMSHRPLIWYLIVGLVDTYTSARLAYSGFSFFQSRRLSVPPRVAGLVSMATSKKSPGPDISYWYRPHTAKSGVPVLFIHGIGIGLYPYANFFHEVLQHKAGPDDDGQIGIIALELLPISFRITSTMPSDKEICRQINEILKFHNIDKVVLATHSYGSVIATHLLRNEDTAPKIGPVLFIDPVTFLLHLPDVAYNFTARKPRTANEHQLYYFASMDMMVSQTLARHFFWSDNILWKEDLRNRDVTVSLGGRDLIVDTETVGKYVNSIDLRSEDKKWKDHTWVGSGLETLWWPTMDHAQVFERKEGRAKLARVVKEYCLGQHDHVDEDVA